MDDMTPEEWAQAASGVGLFSLNWVRGVGHDQIENVWPQMTPNFRLALAQGWIWANPDALDDGRAGGMSRDELAQALAHSHPTNSLFADLARVSMRDIRSSYDDLDVDQLGTSTRPRPVGPGLELVRLLYLADLDHDGQGNYTWPDGGVARGVTVLIEHGTEGMAVAGTADGVLRPGWPPVHEQFIQPSD